MVLNNLLNIMTSKRIFYGLLAVTFLLGSLLTTHMVWSIYFEEPYLYYRNLPFQVLSKAYPGEVVKLSVERCNRTKMTLTYSMTHSFRNEVTKQNIYVKGIDKVSIPPGCHRDIDDINRIPKDLPAGTYVINGVSTVKSFYGFKEVEWYSEPFLVLPNLPTVDSK